MTRERESRPEADTSEPASISTAIKTEATVAHPVDTERCTRCSHPIRAEASIEAGMGPHCRRVRARDWAEVA